MMIHIPKDKKDKDGWTRSGFTGGLWRYDRTTNCDLSIKRAADDKFELVISTKLCMVTRFDTEVEAKRNYRQKLARFAEACELASNELETLSEEEE